MTTQNESQDFVYTYSAKEQDEIKKIRQKYMVQTDDKMEQLRRLDASVTKKGTMMAIILGVIGTLVLGIGMSCVMVWNGKWFIPGIIIGLLGIALMTIAFPVYNYITKKERERVAPEILRLTEELMQE